MNRPLVSCGLQALLLNKAVSHSPSPSLRCCRAVVRICHGRRGRSSTARCVVPSENCADGCGRRKGRRGAEIRGSYRGVCPPVEDTVGSSLASAAKDVFNAIEADLVGDRGVDPPFARLNALCDLDWDDVLNVDLWQMAVSRFCYLGGRTLPVDPQFERETNGDTEMDLFQRAVSKPPAAVRGAKRFTLASVRLQAS